MRKTLREACFRRRLGWVACAFVLTGVVLPGMALAGTPPDVTVADAKRLFSRGTALYLKGRYAEALDALEHSFALVPSPNSQLLIARCLRELGRLVDAQDAFASAEIEARRRAAEGAAKYAQTADSAASEGAAVRSGLGSVRVRIEAASPGTKLVVDGVPTEIPSEGALVFWHAPGDLGVSVRSAAGTEQRQVATVRAGSETNMQFAPPPTSTPDPPQAPHPQVPPMPAEPVRGGEGMSAPGQYAPSWAKPAAYGAGAITLVGGAMFAGFHVATQQTFNSLESYCKLQGGCVKTDPSALQRANSGKTEQTVAYVSLAAGAVSAVAAVTFAVVAWSHPARPPVLRSCPWRLWVGSTAAATTTLGTTTVGLAAYF